jgi:hypothetical protein
VARKRSRIAARIAVLLALLTAGGTVAAGVTLPPSANDQAVSATQDVDLPDTTQEAGTSVGAQAHTPSASAQADFGQCVAENAKDASEEGGQGWQPVLGCESLRQSSNAGASNANENASAGLATAQSARENGALSSSEHRSDNSLAQAGNSDDHRP